MAPLFFFDGMQLETEWCLSFEPLNHNGPDDPEITINY